MMTLEKYINKKIKYFTKLKPICQSIYSVIVCPSLYQSTTDNDYN